MRGFQWLQKKRNRYKRERCLPVPKITLPYNQYVRKQRRRFFLSFVLLLCITSFYTIYSAKKRIANEELVHVWVANQDLQAPAKIERVHLKTNYFPRKNLPKSVFTDVDNVLGKVLIQNVVKNEILLSHHFTQGVDINSISTKFQNLFALTMDENWFEAKFPILAPGDRIDVLTTNPKASFAQTIPIVENIPVIEIQYEEKNDKKTLVVNLTQDEARAVLFARGARLPMQLIVHSSLPLEHEIE